MNPDFCPKTFVFFRVSFFGFDCEKLREAWVIEFSQCSIQAGHCPNLPGALINTHHSLFNSHVKTTPTTRSYPITPVPAFE